MEWISVKDRLPEKDGQYLCYKNYVVGGYCDLLWYGTIYDHGKKRTFYFFDPDYGDIEVSNVTHWMELPEPPKLSERPELPKVEWRMENDLDGN